MILPLVIGMLLGAIVGVIAEQKNRPFFPWALYGFFFFFFAIIHIAIIGDKAYEDRQLAGMGYKKCSACAEMVAREAALCKHCGSALSENGESAQPGAASGRACRWCNHPYDVDKGNQCPACGGLQKHFLKDNPVLLVLIFCLVAAFLILLSQVENQSLAPPPASTTDENSGFVG
ncbi:MAG: hypothetical protein ACE5F7_11710 [Nitrospiria bacterium]